MNPAMQAALPQLTIGRQLTPGTPPMPVLLVRGPDGLVHTLSNSSLQPDS